MPKSHVILLSIGASPLALLLVAPAQAQTSAPTDPTEADQIIVTGSYTT
tara:strand:+ start:3510 stop:3656 length:147 start_codon:yes stop_codon:yes gene_type:complete